MSASWGTGVWNRGTWGVGNIDATVTFQSWGQGTWGNGVWNIGYVTTALGTTLNSVSVQIDNEISVTGEQLNVTLNTVTLTADSNLNLSTNLLQTP